MDIEENGREQALQNNSVSPEESGVLHVVSVSVVGLLGSDANPKEVFRFLTFIYYLAKSKKGAY